MATKILLSIQFLLLYSYCWAVPGAMYVARGNTLGYKFFIPVFIFLLMPEIAFVFSAAFRAWLYDAFQETKNKSKIEMFKEASIYYSSRVMIFIFGILVAVNISFGIKFPEYLYAMTAILSFGLNGLAIIAEKLKK